MGEGDDLLQVRITPFKHQDFFPRDVGMHDIFFSVWHAFSLTELFFSGRSVFWYKYACS